MADKLAFSKMVVKAIDEERREFVGIASSISADRDEDILIPEGAKFTLPMPLLWMHDHNDPVGEIYEAEVIDGGQIQVKGRVASVDQPAFLRERLNEAWAKLKAKLVRGLSVGFRPLEYSFLDDSNGVKFTAWDWYETSLVTVPANSDATLAIIKHYGGKPAQAATGKKGSVFRLSKAATSEDKTTRSNTMYKKQIKEFQDSRAELRVERQNLIKAATEEGRTLDAEEQQKFDELTDKIKSVDDHISRLEMLAEEDVDNAEPVQPEAGTKSSKAQAARSGNHIITKAREAENGVAFAQYVKMIGLARGNPMEAVHVAEAQAKSGAIDRRVVHALKAAVPAASTMDPEWAGNLVHQGNVVADFVEFLRPMTIIGQFGAGNIPALRAVPANTPIDIQTSGGDAYWTGEGKAKPLTSWSYENTSLPEFKLATIAAITKELLRRSTNAADTMIRNELAEAIRSRMDRDFIDPAKALVANVSPASITNGAANQASTNAEADLNFLISTLVAANIPLSSAVLIMSSMNAFALSRRKDPLGNRIFEGLTINGGNVDGVPVIVSDYVGDIVVMVAAREIYLVDEGGLQVDMSDQASLEMSDAPTHDSTTPTATNLVSMWQTNSVAFRAERFINWARRRPQAVAYVTGADYTTEPDAGGGDGGGV